MCGEDLNTQVEALLSSPTRLCKRDFVGVEPSHTIHDGPANERVNALECAMARHMKSTWIPEQPHAAAGADLAKLEVLRYLCRRIFGRMSKKECVGHVIPIFTHAIGRIEGENERAATRGVKDDVPV